MACNPNLITIFNILIFLCWNLLTFAEFKETSNEHNCLNINFTSIAMIDAFTMFFGWSFIIVSPCIFKDFAEFINFCSCSLQYKNTYGPHLFFYTIFHFLGSIKIIITMMMNAVVIISFSLDSCSISSNGYIFWIIVNINVIIGFFAWIYTFIQLYSVMRACCLGSRNSNVSDENAPLLSPA
jgi:hypothetical protein